MYPYFSDGLVVTIDLKMICVVLILEVALILGSPIIIFILA